MSLSRSLALRLMLVAVVMTSFVVAVGISCHRARAEERLEERALLHACSHVTAVRSAVATLGAAPGLRGLVSALGAERDIESIVVARADSGRIIASSRGARHSNETDSSVRPTESGVHVTADEVVVTRPVEIPLGDGRGSVAGVVEVRLDAAPMRRAVEAELSQRTRESVIVAVGLILFFIVMYVVVVARRTHEIATVMAATQKGKRGVRCSAGPDDELGRIATGLNRMLDVLEREEFDRIQRTEVVDRARQVAIDANRSKSAFLANMSHEIRTPMTAMLGFAELLAARAEQGAEAEAWANTIRRNGEHLLGIIDDILDVSKVEAGRLELDEVEFSAEALVADVADLMSVKADEKGVELRSDIAGPVPPLVLGDPIRVRQILVNLLANALKFTEEGFVGIVVKWCSTSDTSGELVARVSDSGIGMTPEELARVFRPFTQADPSVTRRFGGTGLGLTICRNLTELMRGEISAESIPGVGTAITVRIPFEVVSLEDDLDQLDGKNAESLALEGMRVLVAEDGEDLRFLTRLMLEEHGIEVAEACDGRDAIDAVERSVADARPFDLVLMDMQMPELDGYEATRRLRDAGCELPIVAFTAHTMSGDDDACFAAGCDDHVSKPIEREHLLAVCSRFAHPCEPLAGGSAHPSP